MPFNDPNKPKILRTQLTNETHRKFKVLAATMEITMADLVEKLIEERLKKEGYENFAEYH